MEIKWLNAVIDLPAGHFEPVGDFWAAMTATTKGDVHPEHDEYVHLNPRAGDMHIELQRLDAGAARAHLDLLVDDVQAWTDRAVGHGATVLAQPGHVVLETPGGMPFCIVPYGGEGQRGPAIDAERPHAVDQICLDVPYEHFDSDVQFWTELTGWAVNPVVDVAAEYRSFAQPPGLPLRLLVQRLQAEDTGGARAHLDISSGEHVDELAEEHVMAGASIVEKTEYWTVMVDPAGMPYCLTSRPPILDDSAMP